MQKLMRQVKVVLSWSILAILGAVAAAGYASASTTGSAHYISSSTGSDSNPGTKASPWAHAPGMKSCTANCASYTPRPGDQFIFYGGDTWGVTNFQWQITTSGTSASGIYYGVDKTWYSSSVCGAAFCQPIFNFANTLVSSSCAGTGCAGIFFNNASYVTLDNFEIKNFEMPNNNVRNTYRGDVIDGGAGAGSSSDYDTISNNYIHDWGMEGTITSGSSNTSVVDLFGPHMTVTGNILSEQYGVCGNPTSGCVIGGGIHADGTISGNTCSYVDDCIDNYAAGTVISGNVIHDMTDSTDPNNHGNAVHALCYAYIFNNVTYNLSPNGMGVSENLNEPRCSTASGTYYTWNNVFWNGGNQTCEEDRANVPYPGGTVNYYHFNETCNAAGNPGIAVRDVTDGTACPSNIYIFNLQSISGNYNGSNSPASNGPRTSATVPFVGVDGGCTIPTEITITTSVGMSSTTATAQGYGYTASDMYAPTSSSDPTVGKGTNLSGYCSGALQNLCTALSVLGPSQPGPRRPPTGGGNWDIGAYQFSLSGGNPPAPPTGLTATVQ